MNIKYILQVELMIVIDNEVVGEKEKEGLDLIFGCQYFYCWRKDELGVVSLVGKDLRIR